MRIASIAQKIISRPTLPFVLSGRAVNRQVHTLFGRQKWNPSGENILDRDWDNLIILDACRYDYFEQYANCLPGQLSSMTSVGSGTPEFIRGTFSGRSEFDLVYISANPWWSLLADQINSKVYKFISLEEFDCQDDVFDVELPNTVAEYALDAADSYPRKRLLIHFNQPHFPHIGETGRDLFGEGNGPSLLSACTQVRPSRERLQQSYRETLEEVIPAVEQLIAELSGKTVVTADHGEMLKDRQSPLPTIDYGHGPGLYTPKLVTVPWFEAEYEERKQITAEKPEETHTANEKAVVERLKKLGYR